METSGDMQLRKDLIELFLNACLHYQCLIVFPLCSPLLETRLLHFY
jgi:hypothetical protein